MQDTVGAIADQTKAIELNPENVELFLTRGNYYLWSGNYKKAIEDYNVYLINQKGNYLAFLNRGEAYGAMGIYEAAIADYSSAIKLNSSDAALFFERAIYYLESADYINAKIDLYKASNLKYPDKELIQYNLGIAEINLGNTTEACKAFKQCGDMAEEFLAKYCK